MDMGITKSCNTQANELYDRAGFSLGGGKGKRKGDIEKELNLFILCMHVAVFYVGEEMV